MAIFRSREGDATADAAQAVATQANQWGDPFGRLATRSIQIIVVVVVAAGLLVILEAFGLHMLHLHPNAVLILASFAYVCEAFVEVTPSVA